jgi:hypothetical protein
MQGNRYHSMKIVFLYFEKVKIMHNGEEPSQMALVRLKRAAQITLPVELRKRFNLESEAFLTLLRSAE